MKDSALKSEKNCNVWKIHTTCHYMVQRSHLNENVILDFFVSCASMNNISKAISFFATYVILSILRSQNHIHSTEIDLQYKN